MKYIILGSKYKSNLEKAVKFWADKGYELQGGVSVSNGTLSDKREYAQAMVKK